MGGIFSSNENSDDTIILLREKVQQQMRTIEELQKNVQFLVHRNEVKQNKRACLDEMLTTIFCISQPLRQVAVQHEPLKQASAPPDIVNKVHAWMSYYWSNDVTRCDRNARACWATITGDKNRDWVFMNSYDASNLTESPFQRLNEASLQQWCNARKTWLDNGKQTRMIVRFVSTADDTDGHTVVSYKFDGAIRTFQSYIDVCKLTYKEDVCFTEPLIKSLLGGEPINAAAFGIKYESDSQERSNDVTYMTAMTRPSTYETKKCFYMLE